MGGAGNRFHIWLERQKFRLPARANRLSLYVVDEKNYNPERKRLTVFISRHADQTCAIGYGSYYEDSGNTHVCWGNGTWTYYQNWSEFTEALCRWYKERDSATPCQGSMLTRPFLFTPEPGV